LTSQATEESCDTRSDPDPAGYLIRLEEEAQHDLENDAPNAARVLADPFAGSTEIDASPMAAAAAALAESTRTVYAHAWGGWGRWCATLEIIPLPGSPALRRFVLTGLALADVDTKAGLRQTPPVASSRKAKPRRCGRGQ